MKKQDGNFAVWFRVLQRVKTLLEKEKLLVKRYFFFSRSMFSKYLYCTRACLEKGSKPLQRLLDDPQFDLTNL